MRSFCENKPYKCKRCEASSSHPYVLGLCGECTYKELTSHVNSLCETCANKCKQSSLITIHHCPDYKANKRQEQNGPLKARKGTLETRSIKEPRVTGKKKKSAL